MNFQRSYSVISSAVDGSSKCSSSVRLPILSVCSIDPGIVELGTDQSVVVIKPMIAPDPKLPFAGDPGALISPAFAERFGASMKHCAVVQLGADLHNLQEDHPDAIGRSIAGWIAVIEATIARK